METTQIEARFSPRQFATIVGVGEGSVRQGLREERLTASKDEYGRRWIPEAEVVKRFALELTSPVTQEATLRRLRMNAQAARANLGSDEELVAGAAAYLRALNGDPRDPTKVEHEPTWFERKRESVLVGAVH